VPSGSVSSSSDDAVTVGSAGICTARIVGDAELSLGGNTIGRPERPRDGDRG
jgi:hypothetical protein